MLCTKPCYVVFSVQINANNVDQLFPIPRIARMPTALVRPRNATQAESGGLSSLAKLTAFLQANKKGAQAYAGPVQAESRDILTKSMELVVFD